MKFTYFELLSPKPLYIPGIGSIVSPTLKDISSVGLDTYRHYLFFLSTDLKSYLSLTGQDLPKDFSSDEENGTGDNFELLVTQPGLSEFVQNIFNFFIKEDVLFSMQNKCFFIYDNDELTGNITKETYPMICSLILQRCYVSSKPDDLSKAKNEKALEIMQKLQKGRRQHAASRDSDKNLDLGNIISAVANKSSSLNILNIWDLTIFQLYDCFSRLTANTTNEFEVISSAVWGTKDTGFDILSWQKNLYN